VKLISQQSHKCPVISSAFQVCQQKDPFEGGFYEKKILKTILIDFLEFETFGGGGSFKMPLL
jgi:hypothetical protein